MTVTRYYTKVRGGAVACLATNAALLENLHALSATNAHDQRTPEWYEARRKVLTASTFHDVCVSRGKYLEKIISEKVAADMNRKPLPGYAILHGTILEDVACKYYEKVTGGKLHQFGLIQNPKYPAIGASPDGASEHGVLLEIKCPYSRQLVHGEVPIKYMYQIQGQMLVCEIPRCDYLECVFTRYASAADMLSSKTDNLKGVVVYNQDALNNITDVWSSEMGQSAVDACRYGHEEAIRRIDLKITPLVNVWYWELTDVNFVPIDIDHKFIEDMLPKLNSASSILLESVTKNSVKNMASLPSLPAYNFSTRTVDKPSIYYSGFTDQ